MDCQHTKLNCVAFSIESDVLLMPGQKIPLATIVAFLWCPALFRCVPCASLYFVVPLRPCSDVFLVFTTYFSSGFPILSLRLLDFFFCFPWLGLCFSITFPMIFLCFPSVLSNPSCCPCRVVGFPADPNSNNKLSTHHVRQIRMKSIPKP